MCRTASESIPLPVEDVEVSEVAKRVRHKKIPPTVSEEEYNTQMLTLLPFRFWCTFCLRGKTGEDDHRSVGDRPASELPRFCRLYTVSSHGRLTRTL